jgi:S-adenosylmethionine decarboxylase
MESTVTGQDPVVPPGGDHLLIDVHTCCPVLLRDVRLIEDILRTASVLAGATVLNTYFHEFGEGHGVTGIIALSESHISVHTWPECGYAAIDIFMCGKCDVTLALEEIMSRLKGTYTMHKIERGMR